MITDVMTDAATADLQTEEKVKLEKTLTKPQLSRQELMNYTVEESKYGMHTSIAPDGTRMVTAMTEEICRRVTETIHVPSLFNDPSVTTVVVGSARVGGKL